MSEATNQSRQEIRAATLSLVIGIALLFAKFAAYLLTHSTAIFSDALESIVNVMASGLALYSIFLSHQPADEKHPYGHGKVEFMSAAVEGGMMLVAALVILLRAAEQLFQGAQIRESGIVWGVVLIAAAMVINGALGWYLLRAGRRGGSIALEADGKHLLADAVTSAGVLAALLVVRVTGFKQFDPLVGIAIALYVALHAVQLLRRSTEGLMDAQDQADARTLKEILDSHLGPGAKAPCICSYHKLRHRHSGRFHWVDFHICVPKSWNIDRGHRVASEIEYEMEQTMGEANATAHVEPCENDDCATCRAP